MIGGLGVGPCVPTVAFVAFCDMRCNDVCVLHGRHDTLEAC